MAKTYYPTIGLEIHAELKTQTKMFCACKNDPDEETPNMNICPVCMAHPGALPVINKKAIEYVIKVGLSLGSTISDFTEFDRKNYFYPDIPKGYQISQYKYPIVSGGHLADMDITRVHLEEDTANNKHPEGKSTSYGAGDTGGYSLVDFNRAGMPLMELVTEPHTFETADDAAKKASKFAKELQLILWYLGVSEANMEKGEMRVEANISIAESNGAQTVADFTRNIAEGKQQLGTKVEVKNLNSFKSVERAILYEIARMTELMEAGKGSDILQETRGWDESKQKTFSQRKKESSHDYRYFPEPDLPKMKLHEAFDLPKMKSELPELPAQKRARYKNDFEIKDEDVEVYINDSVLGVWFEEVTKILKDKELIKLASNYITNDMIGLMNTVLIEDSTKYPTPGNFAKLISMNFSKVISSAATKKLLGNLVTFNEDPEEVAKEMGLIQTSDEGALKEIVQKIISENPEVVASYKSGKENAIMSLVGKVIKESNGSANPQIVIKLLKEMLQ